MLKLLRREAMLKLLMKTEVEGQVAVELFKTTWGWAVRYGLQAESHLPLGDALVKFNDYVEHAMACAGMKDEEEDA